MMNRPITNAISDNLLIPALIPEIVEHVATAVMHQTISTLFAQIRVRFIQFSWKIQ